MNFLKRSAYSLLAGLVFAAPGAAMAEVGFGKPGEPINLVVGYQPYYTESWSGVVINGQQTWKKYLPKGSTVKFETGLQGSVIVGNQSRCAMVSLEIVPGSMTPGHFTTMGTR